MTSKEKLIRLFLEAPECDRNCELCSYEWCSPDCESYLAKIMAEHLLLNGVIVLPCKVGDIVYLILKNNHTYHSVKCVVDEFSCCGKEVYAVLSRVPFSNDSHRFRAVNITEFGKTIFSSEEETVAKIKECYHNEGNI